MNIFAALAWAHVKMANSATPFRALPRPCACAPIRRFWAFWKRPAKWAAFLLSIRAHHWDFQRWPINTSGWVKMRVAPFRWECMPWPLGIENHGCSTVWENGLSPALCGGHLCGRTTHLPKGRLFGGKGDRSAQLAATRTAVCSQFRGDSLRPDVLRFASSLGLGRAIFGNGGSGCALHEQIARCSVCFSNKPFGVRSNGCSVTWLSGHSGHLLALLVIIFFLCGGARSQYKQGAHLRLLLLLRDT